MKSIFGHIGKCHNFALIYYTSRKRDSMHYVHPVETNKHKNTHSSAQKMTNNVFQIMYYWTVIGAEKKEGNERSVFCFVFVFNQEGKRKHSHLQDGMQLQKSKITIYLIDYRLYTCIITNITHRSTRIVLSHQQKQTNLPENKNDC